MNKYIYTIVCFLVSLTIAKAQAQAVVSIQNQTVTISPGYTVTNSSLITVNGKVKNVSTNSVNDYVYVNMAIDTSSTGTPKYYLRSTVTHAITNLAPDSCFAFNLQDIASVANHYKGGGGGTVIVIWAIVSNQTNTVTTADTAMTKIYLLGVPDNDNELRDFENNILQLPNPLFQNIQLNYDTERYEKVELINVSGQIVTNAITTNKLEIAHLSKGLYFLRFHTKTGNCITKKLIID